MKTILLLPKARTSMALVPLCSLVLGAGCSFAPDYAQPTVQTPSAFKELAPEQFRETEGWKTAEPMDATLRGNWWEAFHEPALSALELQAAASNQTVAGALANFLAARAVVKQVRSQYFPVVTATPSVARAGQSGLQNHSGGSASPSTFTAYSLPFDATWELDFWGRIRNSAKASSLEVQATLADLENVRLTVQAELAADYFQLRVLDAQKELLAASVLVYEESLKLTSVQDGTGLASGQDVAQAETLLNLTRAQATDLGIQRALLEHAIATLIGEPASAFTIATNSLAARPVAIPFGLPSRLLERRPDIAAAERRVAEANARIGVARAAYYPTVTLGGSAGYQSTSLGSFLSGPSFLWSVGSSMAQTLFDAGKRRAATEQVRAQYQVTVANYRQTVLNAFQEVEDNLAAVRILSQELQQQNAAVESSQHYLRLANDRYQAGIELYLDVITAQATLLGHQRTAENLRMQQLTATVQLIKALGGGWDASHDQVSTARNAP